jgi:hypothetical protein
VGSYKTIIFGKTGNAQHREAEHVGHSLDGGARMSNVADPDPHIRFPQRLALRVPEGMPEAVEAAARQRHTNPSEWTRQAVLRALEADGVRLGADGRVQQTPANGG